MLSVWPGDCEDEDTAGDTSEDLSEQGDFGDGFGSFGSHVGCSGSECGWSRFEGTGLGRSGVSQVGGLIPVSGTVGSGFVGIFPIGPVAVSMNVGVSRYADVVGLSRRSSGIRRAGFGVVHGCVVG